jgi:hypothetical protein
MSEPVLSASLLTPISIRLTWTYAGGSADFEVFWKSDHPAGQEYAPLGTTSALTYDVPDLSWTTTYYFKVRAVSGATYGAFGNEVYLFVCCGQAVMWGVTPPEEEPPTVTKVDFWQQAADPDGGEIAFAAKDIPHINDYLWVYEGGEWHFKASATIIYNVGTFFPVAVRKVGDKIAIYDINAYYDWAGWYWFAFWDGNSMVRSYPMPPSDEWWYTRQVSFKSLPYSMEFNENGRIVVARCYVDWEDGDNDWPSHVNLAISNDYGVTWGAEIPVSTDFGDEDYPPEVCIAEDGANNIWIAHTLFDHDEKPSWANPETVYAMYNIYKYSDTGGVVQVGQIETNLYNTYGPGPTYTQTGWATLVRNCKIYAEGTKVAICYVYDFTMTGTPPGSYYGTGFVRVKVSNDYGATFSAAREVTIPAGTIGWDAEWSELLPAICISNDDLLVYLLNGTTAANQVPVILKSTDDGDSWSIVYDFPEYDMDYPWVMQLRSDGDHVTATACGSSLEVGGALALWESLDGGDTWTALEIVPTVEPQILVPA